MFPKIKPIGKNENEEDYMFHWVTFLEMGKIGISHIGQWAYVNSLAEPRQGAKIFSEGKAA